MNYPRRFDVIVVGGGHAGTEAATAAARMGCETLLLTQNIETIGQMSCNPAIGGIGKSHLVKEIDALGGVMGLATDQAGIQFRVLNSRKGPAVRATRAQTDRQLYKYAIREALEKAPNLALLQQSVEDLILTGERIEGVVTAMGIRIKAPTVILTVGTFLAGLIHVGLTHHAGGRAGDPAATRLAERLRELPFRVDRLKTGTPPRLDGTSIDYSALARQPGDQPEPVMSYMASAADHPQQVDCHITYTNERTHDIIRAGLDRSPLYTGVIDGVGPRYCPSIEDKVVRFAGRSQHQIFIEPEGLRSTEVYPNGISTSLPFDVQVDLVRSVRGFESVQITRPGYAIEYDFFDPQDLQPTLETRFIEGLYFAGQINGTTGYEEAAAQGLIAGINVARRVREESPWYPRRDQAYIGVMIDDLITQGTKEPYRMFTSRAEYRLILRQDNADRRLTEIGRDLGLVDDRRWASFCKKRERIAARRDEFDHAWIRPDTEAGDALNRKIEPGITREYTLTSLLKRPQISISDLSAICALGDEADDIDEQVEIDIKYEGYISRQEEEIARVRRQDQLAIPTEFDYESVKGLSTEVRQRLVEVRPHTVGQAGRIAGVTHAAISLLLIHLKKQGVA